MVAWWQWGRASERRTQLVVNAQPFLIAMFELFKFSVPLFLFKSFVMHVKEIMVWSTFRLLITRYFPN